MIRVLLGVCAVGWTARALLQIIVVGEFTPVYMACAIGWVLAFGEHISRAKAAP